MAYNRKLLYTKSFPSWNTPEGNLGSVVNAQVMTPIQLVATEINEPGSTITYAVTVGALPTGLTLSSSGEISGTPNSPGGYFNFTITATDDEGETATRDFNILVQVIYDIQYLIVAGGAGGSGFGGGGGGAGGVIESTINKLIGELIPITVGSGGAGGTTPSYTSGNGGNSSAFDFTAIGGGASGWDGLPSGIDGGSGGGAGTHAGGAGIGGVGTSGQGNNGGAQGGQIQKGAGGGGAGGVGINGNTNSRGGDGGIGLTSSISGSSTYYAGGGGGGVRQSAGVSGGNGGLGGGGRGSNYNTNNGSAGVSNTGGGGGGGRGYNAADPGFNGGSGVVILRMPTANYSGTTTGSPTVTTDGSDTILTYTGSGTYTT